MVVAERWVESRRITERLVVEPCDQITGSARDGPEIRTWPTCPGFGGHETDEPHQIVSVETIRRQSYSHVKFFVKYV